MDYPGPEVYLHGYAFGSYYRYDRFGRVAQSKWVKGGSGAGNLDLIYYGYDYAGNRKWREDVLAAANSKDYDEFYSYDGLHRLTNAQRGNLTDSPPTGINSSTRNREQDWTLDQLGNWPTFKDRDTDTGSTWDLNQSRTHNAANELTHIASSTTHVAEDDAGNMIKIPTPLSWGAHYDLKYDAWNRLVEVREAGI
ncbi:MAG: hypothetical protein WD971_03550 [Pirellulales bacterium]